MIIVEEHNGNNSRMIYMKVQHIIQSTKRDKHSLISSCVFVIVRKYERSCIQMYTAVGVF